METGNPLISSFRKNQLRPIMDNSAYHSPEVSETDEENGEGQRKIVTKDLNWRSSTVKLI